MSQILQHKYVKPVAEAVSSAYTSFTSNDVAKNVTGVLIGLAFCFGLFEMSTLMWFLNLGLFIFAVRETTRLFSENTAEPLPMFQVVFAFISLFTIQLTHGFLSRIIVFTGIPFIQYLVNFVSLYFVTRLVSDVNTYVTAHPITSKISFKDFNFATTAKGICPTYMVTLVNFATKFYAINNVVVDGIVNYGASATVAIFCWIEKSLFFAFKIAQSSYSKLSEIAGSMKSDNSTPSAAPASVELAPVDSSAVSNEKKQE